MSPTEIIERAAEDGVLLALSPSGSISAKGVQSAIDRWLPAIRQSKAAIVLLLRPSADSWSAKDQQAFFDERAGIAEFDGGLSRSEAEAQANAEVIASVGKHVAAATESNARNPLVGTSDAQRDPEFNKQYARAREEQR